MFPFTRTVLIFFIAGLLFFAPSSASILGSLMHPAETGLLPQVSLQTVRLYAIEVISAEIFVVALVLLQVVANDYKAMCHRDDRPLAATSGRHSPELRRQVGVLGSRRSPGTLTCHATQPRTTFARCTAQAFAGTFVVTWAQGSPTGQLFSRRKLRHGVTYFG